VGLTGNLRDFTFLDRLGHTVKGSDVPYGEASGTTQPVGYAADPADAITYVEAHDNETLFDALQYKLPRDTPMADRVRMNTIALSTTAFGQSPSFWHAGTDLLRSKSLDHNSYNSGDWFNRIDWAGQESTWGSGLPPAPDNSGRWDVMRPLLADPALEPGPAAMAAASAQAADLLRIRASTPLFHLGDARLIGERVSFPGSGPGQTPGVITMAIEDRSGTDVDPQLDGLVVIFNASDEATRQTVAGLAGRRFALHPVQLAGADAVVRQSAYDAATGAFDVPARTVAVFVEPSLRAGVSGGPVPAGARRGRCVNLHAGTSASERLTGTAFGDTIVGYAGDDVIDGLGGRDCLSGKAGDDRVRGGADGDTVDGQSGRDRVAGGRGRDTVRGGAGGDRASGGRRADLLQGEAGPDRLRGGPGRDLLTGGLGRDDVDGGPGRDAIESGAGADRISARDGARDSIDCGRGVDTVLSRDPIDKLTSCERTGTSAR
jgi:hypothetical protein